MKIKELFEFFLLIFIPSVAFSQLKYEIECRNDLLQYSQIIGMQQVGTIELGNRNDGSVAKYLKSVGLSEGNPYCAAGQYYIFYEACKHLKLPQSQIPIPRTGLANAMYSYAKQQGNKVKYEAKLHDLLVWRKAKTSFGHIERIIEVNSKGNVTTLAFNVMGTNGKEGVFTKKRNIYHPLQRLKVRGLIGFRSIK
jgi:hypothetical protein